MNIVARICGACAASAICASAAAEAPDVKGLFPAGVQRGQSVSVRVIGKPGSQPPQVWCDREGIVGQPGEKPEEVTLTAAAEAQPGVCWLRLHTAEGAAPLRPFFVGVLPEIAEVEPNGATADAQIVDAAGTTVNGVLDRAGDVDVFQVALAAGQTLVASLEANRTLGSPMDGVLQVLSPRGFVLRQNDDDHGLDPQVVFTAPQDGVYAVRVFAFPKDPNTAIRFAGGEDYVYRLTLTTGPFVDRALPEPGVDGSWLLEGWNIAEGVRVSPRRHEDRLEALIEMPGTWQFERLPPLPEAMTRESDSATLLTVQVPGAVWGTINPEGDMDAYIVRAAPGRCRLRVTARAIGSPLDAVLSIRDAAGTLVREVDDNGADAFDPSTDFDVPAEGELRVEVGDRFRHGGERWFYVFSAVPDAADFSLELNRDAFVLAGGGTLEVPVKVTRTGGFGEHIALTVNGLPDGVTASMAGPPEAVEASAETGLVIPHGVDTVTLKLEAAADVSCSGPLTIIGTAGPEAQRRAATAALVSEPLRTPHVWLTVTAAP